MQQPQSVSDINNYLKSLVEADFVLNSVLVRGEVSNFKDYKSGGQWYFSLKDEEAQINCVVFGSAKMKFVPKDGDSVVVKGKVTVFNKRGTYNIQVFWLEPEGVGELAKAFQLMKEKLEKEALFDQDHKKCLPKFPQKIAVLSAVEGAAVHDVITVAQRRDPSVQILVVPTIVQGGQAINSIVNNIELANKYPGVDVIILARGGGSLEDLWAFNEEKVARAIYKSKVPVVSAVGHEVDVTIADFVADVRAATPSVAAELVVPDKQQYIRRVSQIQDYLISGLERLMADQYQTLDYLGERLKDSLSLKYERAKSSFDQLLSRLEDLNPLTVLKRGYAVVEMGTTTINSINEVSKGDIITVLLQDGSLETNITGKKKNTYGKV